MSEGDRESRRLRWRVVVNVLVVVAALAAGATWAVGSADPQVQWSTAASRAAVIGTWQLQDGTGRIRLDSDGQFTATSLPDELFNIDQGGETSTTGTWKLGSTGRYVALDPVGSPPDADTGPGPNIGLGVVEGDHVPYLCVNSGTPGVLCDYLLKRIPG